MKDPIHVFKRGWIAKNSFQAAHEIQLANAVILMRILTCDTAQKLRFPCKWKGHRSPKRENLTALRPQPIDCRYQPVARVKGFVFPRRGFCAEPAIYVVEMEHGSLKKILVLARNFFSEISHFCNRYMNAVSVRIEGWGG
jgi:hypothetical protein